MIVSDVEHLPECLPLGHERRQRSDDVAHPGEAASLGAIAVNRDRLVRQRLADEIRQDHSIVAVLPRSNGVEEPHDDRGKAVLLPVRQREEFVYELAGRVPPAAFMGRAQHKVGVFPERELNPFSVHL